MGTIQEELEQELKDAGIDMNAVVSRYKFIPSPGPQTDAYFSDADILLFGGEAGGGKSALILGLALNEHHRALVIRQQFTDLGGLTEELIKLYGSRDGFTASPRPKFQTNDGQLIEFGALSNPGDEFSWQGRPHDLICFDEGVQLREAQVRFLMGWNRTTKDKQRCRVVIATNPPVSSEGDWIVRMFSPWLDPKHPNPAKHGELRWFITNEHGKDEEVPSSEPVERDGKKLIPLSRTFIRSRLSDNPYLSGTGYDARLDAMPEPYRSALRDGNFMLARKDDIRQLIPTSWVLEAQARWIKAGARPPEGVPLCNMGLDCSGGGNDDASISMRYDYWFSPFITIPGTQTKFGEGMAAPLLKHRRDNAYITIDMGGGYGNVPFKVLRENIDPDRVKAFKGTEATHERTADNMYGFTNKRTMVYYRMREALDPTQIGGSSTMLPDDPDLVAELCTATFEILGGKIKMEPKEEVEKRLGRGVHKGDSVCYANLNGPRGFVPDRGSFNSTKNSSRTPPPVVLGYANRKRR